jgi:SPX domain protein involved in polyphosphate accumulation
MQLPRLSLPALVAPTLTPTAAATRDMRQLRRAMVEFYRGLGLLSSFAALNGTAVVKILKKHDKCSGARARAVQRHAAACG